MVQKKRKIAILGTGNVGATIAYTLTQSGICSEILLVDINRIVRSGSGINLNPCIEIGIKPILVPHDAHGILRPQLPDAAKEHNHYDIYMFSHILNHIIE